MKSRNLFLKTGVTLFNWKYWDWKRNISIQNCLVRSQTLRQIEWEVQNGSITKNENLPLTTLHFEKFFSVYELPIKSWFDVPTTQMSIFLLFVSAGVHLREFFSLLVSLNQWMNKFIRKAFLVKYFMLTIFAKKLHHRCLTAFKPIRSQCILSLPPENIIKR